MGDILSFSLRRFRGLPWTTVSLLKVRQRLVEAARAGGFARSVAPSAPLAHPIVGALDSVHRSVAPAASALGGQENSSPAPPKVPARAGAGAGHPPARAQTPGLGARPRAPRPAGSERAASGPDGADAAQPGWDRGFQRLVPHGRRRTPGAADPTRSVQPLRAVSAPVAQPGRAARAAHDAAAVPPAGLPQAIRGDNGSPFGGPGALGLSRLSMWWLPLGVRVEFIRPARPGDNAGHERFHGCYQRAVVAAGAGHRAAMQQRSTRWRAQYNGERPHEALGQRTPAQVYRPSRRVFAEGLSPLRYPRGWKVRRVRNRGHIKWRGRLRFVGRAFAGQTVGLKTVGAHQWEVFLGRQLIGHLHTHDADDLPLAHSGEAGQGGKGQQVIVRVFAAWRATRSGGRSQSRPGPRSCASARWRRAPRGRKQIVRLHAPAQEHFHHAAPLVPSLGRGRGEAGQVGVEGLLGQVANGVAGKHVGEFPQPERRVIGVCGRQPAGVGLRPRRFCRCGRQ